MLNLDEKICTKCNVILKITEFYICNGKSRSFCKKCELQNKKSYYINNKLDIDKKRKNHYYENKKKVREQQSKYRKVRANIVTGKHAGLS